MSTSLGDSSPKLLLFVLLVAWASASRASEPDKTPLRLTAEEDIVIREIVYGERLQVVTPQAGPWAKRRIVVLPAKLAEVYKAKPAATVTLLRDIVKGGRPGDAITALGYAVALVKDVALAEPYAYHPVDRVDFQRNGEADTLRQNLVKEANELLARVDK